MRGLYNRENIKQMTCTSRTKSISADHTPGSFFSCENQSNPLFARLRFFLFNGTFMCFFFFMEGIKIMKKKTPSQPTPPNRRCWTYRFCMHQVSKYPFPHKFYVKYHENSFCFSAQLKTNIGKRYRVLMNIYRVIFLGYHVRNHHGFLTNYYFF